MRRSTLESSAALGRKSIVSRGASSVGAAVDWCSRRERQHHGMTVAPKTRRSAVLADMRGIQRKRGDGNITLPAHGPARGADRTMRQQHEEGLHSQNAGSVRVKWTRREPKVTQKARTAGHHQGEQQKQTAPAAPVQLSQ